jgi:hypothetical protein
MKYFTDPLTADTPDFYSKAKGLLDVTSLSRYKVSEVSVHTGLDSEFQLSQSQLSQDVPETVRTITNVDVQKAFSILNPLFKSIVAVANDSRSLTLACEGLRRTRMECLTAQDEINEKGSNEKGSNEKGSNEKGSTTSGANVRFRSSNLELDKYAKSNKRIKAMGEIN